MFTNIETVSEPVTPEHVTRIV